MARTASEGTRTNRHDSILMMASLSSVLLASLHLAGDVARGFEPGGFKNINGVLILVAWLYGTLGLAGRRLGHIAMLLGAMLGMAMCLAHMRGAGLVGGRIAGSSGVLLWVWTLLALGVTSALSAVLAARGLFTGRVSAHLPASQERTHDAAGA